MLTINYQATNQLCSIWLRLEMEISIQKPFQLVSNPPVVNNVQKSAQFLLKRSASNLTVCWVKTASKLLIASFDVFDRREEIFAQQGYCSKVAEICLQLSISLIASVYSERVSNSFYNGIQFIPNTKLASIVLLIYIQF